MAPEPTTEVLDRRRHIHFSPFLDASETAPPLGLRLQHSHAALMADMDELYSDLDSMAMMEPKTESEIVLELPNAQVPTRTDVNVSNVTHDKPRDKFVESLLERFCGLSVCGAILVTCGLCLMATDRPSNEAWREDP